MTFRNFFRRIWAIPITWTQIRDIFLESLRLLALILAVLGIVVFIIYVESHVEGKNWNNIQDFVKALKDSAILGVLESITIITGVVLFIVSGKKQERKRSNYLAWIVIDIAGERRTSYARIQALTDLNNDGVSLTKLDFRKANLEGIWLEGADLSSASLDYTNFKNSHLNKVRFWNAKLKEANFELARLKNANFYNAKLENAQFGRGRLQYVLFQQATLCDADFSRAELESADFTYANLKKSNFSSANLKKAIFRNANLESTTFRNSIIDLSDFSGASNVPLQEILSAQGWKTAKFDPEIRRQLHSLTNSES